MREKGLLYIILNLFYLYCNSDFKSIVALVNFGILLNKHKKHTLQTRSLTVMSFAPP